MRLDGLTDFGIVPDSAKHLMTCWIKAAPAGSKQLWT